MYALFSKTIKLVEIYIGYCRVSFHLIAPNHMPHNKMLWLVNEIIKWNFALGDLFHSRAQTHLDDIAFYEIVQ